MKTSFALPGMFLLGALALGGCRPEGRACSRLAELCAGDKEGKTAQAECVSAFDKMRGAAGPEAVDKAARCVSEATSCTGAAGCLVGGIGGGMVNEFLKGLGKTLN